MFFFFFLSDSSHEVTPCLKAFKLQFLHTMEPYVLSLIADSFDIRIWNKMSSCFLEEYLNFI